MLQLGFIHISLHPCCNIDFHEYTERIDNLQHTLPLQISFNQGPDVNRNNYNAA